MGSSTSHYSSSSTPRPPKYRTRSVPMKVLALGLPRTGTASLTLALQQIGYANPYHFNDVMHGYNSDCNKWVKALAAKYERKGWLFRRREWDDLLCSSQAVTDIPCIIFYRELLRTYPEAKVILTVRASAQEWAQSYTETIRKWFKDLYNSQAIKSRVLRFLGIKSSFQKMCEMIDRHYLAVIDEDPEKYYDWYISEIKRIVKRDKLLIFDVKDGYGPLYQFLNAGVPPSREFPHINTRQTFPAFFMNTTQPIDSIQSSEQALANDSRSQPAQVEAYNYRGIQSE